LWCLVADILNDLHAHVRKWVSSLALFGTELGFSKNRKTDIANSRILFTAKALTGFLKDDGFEAEC